MLLEYGALIIALYACMFGPVIAGLIFIFKIEKVWAKIVGVLIIIALILMAIEVIRSVQ